MTETTSDDRDMAEKAFRIFMLAGDKMAEHGLTPHNAAHGAIWAAVDFAGRLMEPAHVIEWMRDVADKIERNHTEGVPLPGYLN